MNKIRWITVSILFLFIINSCSIYKKDIANEINKDGYAVNFIEYDKKYEIDIDNVVLCQDLVQVKKRDSAS